MLMNEIKEKNQALTPDLVKKIGKTTYEVKIHFSATNKETMNDKIKRMLKTEVSLINQA